MQVSQAREKLSCNNMDGKSAPSTELCSISIVQGDVTSAALAPQEPHETKGLQVVPMSTLKRVEPKAIGTSQNFTADERQTTKSVDTLRLRQHPCFQRLLLDPNIQAEFLGPQSAQLMCRLAANPGPQ